MYVCMYVCFMALYVCKGFIISRGDFLKQHHHNIQRIYYYIIIYRSSIKTNFRQQKEPRVAFLFLSLLLFDADD
jgi:hypothetical protein